MRTCILMWICYYGFFFVLTRTIKSNCMKYKSSFREIVQIQSIWIWYTFVIKALKFHDHHFEDSNSLDLFFSQNGVSTWRNFENHLADSSHCGWYIFWLFSMDIHIRHSTILHTCAMRFLIDCSSNECDTKPCAYDRR